MWGPESTLASIPCHLFRDSISCLPLHMPGSLTHELCGLPASFLRLSGARYNIWLYGGGLEDLNSRAYTWTLTHWAIFPVWAIDLFKIGVLEVVLALLTSNIVFSLVWFWISYIEWASLVWTHAVACCWGSSPQQPNHTFLYVLSTQFIFKN